MVLNNSTDRRMCEKDGSGLMTKSTKLLVWAMGLILVTVWGRQLAAQPLKSAGTGSSRARPSSQRKKRVSSRKKKRRGEAPCMTKDPGFRAYTRWSRRISMGQMIAPKAGGISKTGGFDLLVHFHGHYPIRKEFVKVSSGVVLVAIDLGIGSGAYSRAFASPRTFERLLKSVAKEMARHTGHRKAHIRKLGLSSWSAGYGAIKQILRQPLAKRVDSLILLDSVYGGYIGKGSKQVNPNGLKDFVKFARLAAKGKRFMFQSHSSIVPPGYASTRDVSRFMVKQLGGRLRRARRNDVLGLTLFERFDRGKYYVRGYRGNDKPDHCAHLGLMKDVLKVHIMGRWHTPRARGRMSRKEKTKRNARQQGKVHIVVSGEHLTKIARRYGVSVGALRRLNKLPKSKPLRIGQELILPKQSRKKGAKSLPAKSKSKRAGLSAAERRALLRRGARMHVVADGQSLRSIAKRYLVSVSEIKKINKLKPRKRRIQPGDELLIPKAAKRRNRGSSPRRKKQP